MKKSIIIALIIIGGIAFYAFSAGSADQDDFVVTAETDGSAVLVESVTLDAPGFVVIREVINDRPGQIVEVSDLLPAGRNTNVTIGLGAPSGIEGIDIGGGFPLFTSLAAVVYYDDGDGGFNSLTDTVAYVNGNVLAEDLGTGERAQESAVVPNVQAESLEGEVAVTVRYTDQGFLPKRVEIQVGDTVKFINESSRPMWVASDVHPAHTILPTFDQFTTSAYGESYFYTFQEAGEWRYHDHVNANELGTVMVSE
tara:strand:- start:7977 stop:8738 length:762 start_codon:yes stop_codon:yes gene_type:complete